LFSVGFFGEKREKQIHNMIFTKLYPNFSTVNTISNILKFKLWRSHIKDIAIDADYYRELQHFQAAAEIELYAKFNSE
jgi:hypothetical protein